MAKRGPKPKKKKLPVTPPGQMEDRILKPKVISPQIICPYCNSSNIRTVQRAGTTPSQRIADPQLYVRQNRCLYRCVDCNHKFFV